MAATLYLDHRGLELSLQGKALVIHQAGEYQRSIPLNLLERIVCRASVDIKTSVLASLADRGIGVSLFGGRKGRLAAHLSGAGTLDVQRRVGQYRCYLDRSARIEWSTRLITHKLLRQQRLLQRALRQRPDRRLLLFRSNERIEVLRQRLLQEPFATIDSLRGIEGAAAHHYFQAYAGILPPGLEFTGRNRRPPRDPVNALLSLGYTLLHGDIQQAVVSVGLDPWLGLYHEPAHGRASLVCDIQELYRHIIDEFTWVLTRQRLLRENHFATEGDACLLAKEGRAIYYPLYETMMQARRRGMRRVLLYLARAWQAQ